MAAYEHRPGHYGRHSRGRPSEQHTYRPRTNGLDFNVNGRTQVQRHTANNHTSQEGQKHKIKDELPHNNSDGRLDRWKGCRVGGSQKPWTT